MFGPGTCWRPEGEGHIEQGKNGRQGAAVLKLNGLTQNSNFSISASGAVPSTPTQVHLMFVTNHEAESCGLAFQEHLHGVKAGTQMRLLAPWSWFPAK